MTREGLPRLECPYGPKDITTACEIVQTFLEAKRRTSFDRRLLLPHKLVQLLLKWLFFFTQNFFMFTTTDRPIALLLNQA